MTDTPEKNIEELVADVSKHVSDEHELKDVIDKVVGQIEHAKENGYDCDKYVNVGISALDGVLGGIEAGWLIILGARPGMGKTQMSLIIAENVAKSGKAVTFFSLEMSRDELVRRLLLENTKTTATEAKYGHVSTEQLKKINENAATLYGVPLKIDDRGGVNTRYIDKVVADHVERFGTKLVVVDYIQLIDGNARESTYEKATKIANELKNIAKRHGVAVIALSQLNRLNEQRNNKRPNMSELRDSGSLEQNADIIMLLYRDGYYTQDQSNMDLEVNVAKHRHGSAKRVTLYYNPRWGTIKDKD